MVPFIAIIMGYHGDMIVPAEDGGFNWLQLFMDAQFSCCCASSEFGISNVDGARSEPGKPRNDPRNINQTLIDTSTVALLLENIITYLSLSIVNLWAIFA